MKRYSALAYIQQDYSSRLLASKVGLTQRTAANWIAEFKAKGKEGFLAGPSYSHVGNHRIPKRDISKIVNHFRHSAHREEFSTRLAVRELKQQKNVSVSHSWAAKLAHKAGLPARLRSHKPETSPAQRNKRIVFAKGWDRPHTSIVFTDEFGVALDGMVHTRRWFWGPPSAPVPPIPTTKFPPVLHVFAAVTHARTLRLVFYEGVLNSERLCEMMDPVIDECVEVFGDEEWILQHDGSSIYTSAHTQDWLQRNPNVPYFFSHGEWPPVRLRLFVLPGCELLRCLRRV